MRDTLQHARRIGGDGAGGSYWWCKRLELVRELRLHDSQTSQRSFSMSLGGFSSSEISEYVAGRERARQEIVADLDEIESGIHAN